MNHADWFHRSHRWRQPSGNSLSALFNGRWRFCVVYIDIVLSNRPQHVMVDSCRSKLVNVVSGLPQGWVMGTFLFLLYTSQLFSILKNNLIGYADDSTLMTGALSPGGRVTVAESLKRDFDKVSELCDLWGMKFYANNDMIDTRSLTMHPQSTLLTTGLTLMK